MIPALLRGFARSRSRFRAARPPCAVIRSRARGRLSTFAAVGALLLGIAGCSSSSRLPAPFVFNSPGDVALACFDSEPDGDDARVVLPTRCCTTDARLDGCPDRLDDRLSHALVTQTARGEVAAVDLDDAKVLDSERRVPGYTFVDVGGLPEAIVVPDHLPGRPAFGPQWTYVAGRDVNSIRAIGTCRFRIGEACGPELELDTSEVSARAQTEIPLPEAPQDMVLDPDGTALWVSLPRAGWIARIDLGALDPAEGEEVDAASPPPFVTPFATQGEGSLAPREPTYFVAQSGVALEPPTLEDVGAGEEYRSICGTGYEFVPSTPDLLPASEPATSSGRALPTRMRLLPQRPGTSLEPEPLLFVADPGQAALHAFAIVDGALQQRAVLPVGAPLRDFVITAPVPSTAPDFASLVDSDAFAYAEPPPDDKRYLFGIDERDGSVMAFELSFEGETPALQPLVAPAPARHEIDVSRHVRDRLMFDGASARALEIIDTRYRALAEWRVADDVTREHRDALYCGATPVDELDEAIAAARARRAPKAEIEALEDVKEWTELGARADVLRGVFLVVAASDGRLTIIDVHDLDLQCRARAGCAEGGNPDGTEHSDDTSAPSLALRRHARRVLTADAAEALVTDRDNLVSPSPEAPDGEAADFVCPDGYYGVEGAPVCAVADPWQARNRSWSVIYEGRTSPIVPGALLERAPGAELVTLWGPQAWDFCARGANAAHDLKVAIVSSPDPDVAECETYSYGSEPPLFVVEAYQDHLVLAPRRGSEQGGGEEPAPEEDGGMPSDGDAGEPGAAEESWDLDELMRCYPGFLNAEIRLHDQYLVVYDEGVYLHRNRADASGMCVENEELDPRLTSRVSGPDWVFQDFSLSFELDVAGDRDEIAPVVQLTNQSSFLGILNVDTSSGRADALPSRVRFFPGTDALFVVDRASQGLRRYTLQPFQHDGNRFR